MKVKILIASLVVSLLANIAGLVFFILFLDLRGDYKSVKRERNIMAHNLSTIRTQSVVGDVMQSERIHRRTFLSHVDGAEDEIAIMPPYLPTPRKDLVLLVYLHGMGSNYLEPFFNPPGIPVADAIVRSHPNTVILSCNYRKQASWGVDAAMSDISQNIRHVREEFPIEKIVIMGTSMGGCTALTYAASAPEDIKKMIAGVVSVESSGDLAALFNESEHPALKPALIAAFGGAPDQVPEAYKRRSFLSMVEGLPPSMRVAVVSATQDSIVPPHMQKDIVAALSSRKVPAKLIEVDSGHGCPPSEIYVSGLDFVLTGKTG